jgi:BirA family transcriptional regulator, biotin operon repressor / biotin---[acetyl-CoA-carboxylase] ligase
MAGINQNYKLISLDNVDSTNNYLKKLCVEKSVDEGTVIMAAYQNAGKGQGKNSWHAEKGENLTVSILFNPLIKAIDHFMISEFISLGIIDTLAFLGIASQIKWPNDIYAGDKKIAGILVENSIMNNTIFQTIVGIGLNVNEEDFPVELPNPTSIKLLLNKETDIREILNVLVKNLFERYTIIKEGKFKILHDEYNSLLYRKNLLRNYNSEDKEFTALLIGVGMSGEMKLKMEDGFVKEYLFGEVKMIIL